ncbi:MAG: fused MFS/spermidine synthase [Rhodospirillaceae bacterium]|nr:fused MFS/spermidine synthase [Rhodospirillaceae bacterium]
MRDNKVVIALTIFLGAFLLFAVEPMIAKMILPWFGGSAAVWLTCLLFFQGALLAGYIYAHLLTSKLSARRQGRVHIALLVISLAVLPIIPADTLKPTGGGMPLLQILLVLSATIGLPFLLLASTGPLMQTWFARGAGPDASVYRLYSLSNIASLLALLSYPALVEPQFATHVQAWGWSAVYALFVLTAALAAWRSSHIEAAPEATDEVSEPVQSIDRLFWFLLSAVPSILLLAVTNYVLRNIAAIPLLWVMPLALYLLSFIICFDHPRWYDRPTWYLLLPMAFAVIVLSIVKPFLIDNFLVQLLGIGSAFFVCCMVCHGELASQKPAPAHLTSFYLTIGGGGVAGGLAVAAIAPILFNKDHDLAIALMMFSALVGAVAWKRWPVGAQRWVRWAGLAIAPAAWPVLVWILVAPSQPWGVDLVLNARNFYGPLEVTSRPMNVKGDVVLELQNGNIMHGRQLSDPARACEPLSYYARGSGVGLAIAELGKAGPVKVGVIGLGAGTIAGYARPGDHVRFYEINPLVRDIATNVFSFLKCGDTSVAMGDARLTLEREEPNNFDVLAIDAFSSDAIPVHLLTTETFDLYWKHLKPGGVLAVHVSNRFIDLVPIVGAAAERSGKTARLVFDESDETIGGSRSDWVLVTNGPEFFDAIPTATEVTAAPRPWTDDYSNLWRALNVKFRLD